jgi:mannan endo-1,4-beta-mannosidase
MTSGRFTALALATAALLGPAFLGGGDDAPGANGAKRAGPTVLEYLQGIGGRYTVAGIHNREPNSRPDLQTNQLHALVERYPGLWSGLNEFLMHLDHDLAHSSSRAGLVWRLRCHPFRQSGGHMQVP